MQVRFVVLVISFFLALIAIEELITRLQGNRGLSVEDAVSPRAGRCLRCAEPY